MALLLSWLTLFSLHAQTTAKSRPAPAPGSMSIEYGSPSWNADSRKIDSAFMVVKDKTTGKLVQIQLEETAPDSSRFEGQFHVNLGDKALDPQVYVPPKELRNAERDYKKVHEMIQNGQLEPKPLVTKQNDQGQSVLDVYDTKDQAAAAQKAWIDQQRLQAKDKHQQLIKPVPGKEKAAAAADAEHQTEMQKLAMQAATQEAERVRMEQIERQKAEERAKAQRALSEKEKAARKAEAAKLVEEGMAHFNQGRFAPAEKLFGKAIELDPENPAYQFKEGVALYRLERYNEAIVHLKLAKVPPESEVERQYFMGLVHYRIKEYDQAKAAFKVAAASSDKMMGPASNFYLGIVLYSQEQYEDAKKAFEIVIDTSSDPKMDTQAEQYIEMVLQQMQFKKMQEKPWTLTGTLGMNYDSNVTFSPDQSSSGSATKIDDLRLNTVADVAYRAIYNRTHELAAKANANLTNSRRDSAGPSDPWLYNLSVPYSHKGTGFGKPYIWSVKPAYEMLYMDPNDTGTKSQTMASTVLDFDNTFVTKTNLMSIYSLQIRQDIFDLSSSTGADNFDAMKYTLKTTQIMYRDSSRKEALTGILGVTLNEAKGANKKYQRVDISANYTRPMKWGYSWNLGLAVYKIKYAKASPERNDLDLALSTGFDKPIRDWVTWSVSGTYTKNDSNIESSYEYDKYVIMTQAVFTTIL